MRQLVEISPRRSFITELNREDTEHTEQNGCPASAGFGEPPESSILKSFILVLIRVPVAMFYAIQQHMHLRELSSIPRRGTIYYSVCFVSPLRTSVLHSRRLHVTDFSLTALPLAGAGGSKLIHIFF